ncbi:hypothetical protein AB0C13_22400 [Streptomyces sp. NPDC049099]|uniref:hypothetical protein n=1 Tax=Streptomyces sp. NPDC049099 TaxID=3155768 RepID=UPI003426B0EA
MYDTLRVAVHPTGPGSCRVTVAGDLDVVTAPVTCSGLGGHLLFGLLLADRHLIRLARGRITVLDPDRLHDQAG